jgi:hypothetical protein
MTRSLCGKLNYDKLVIMLANQLQFLEGRETRNIWPTS